MPAILFQYLAWESWARFGRGIPSIALCASGYDSKDIRVTSVDDMIGGTGNDATDIQNALSTAQYAQWEETGLCPLMVDMERFLEALALNDQLTTQQNTNTIQEFTLTLFEAMGGTVGNTAGDVMVEGTPSATTLNLSVSDDVTNYCNFTISQVGNFSWLDYGTIWNIYEIGRAHV